MIRSDEIIERTKVARYEPRQSGRTMRMILSLPDETDQLLYIVAHGYQTAKMIVDQIARVKGTELASQCVPIGSKGCITKLMAVDPFNVFIDHTALEYSELRDIKFLYGIVDQQMSIWRTA